MGRRLGCLRLNSHVANRVDSFLWQSVLTADGPGRIPSAMTGMTAMSMPEDVAPTTKPHKQ